VPGFVSSTPGSKVGQDVKALTKQCITLGQNATNLASKAFTYGSNIPVTDRPNDAMMTLLHGLFAFNNENVKKNM
jgi:hypothetical protein